ncbi:hypothetical protein GCM10007898_08980 [Dyella flagellata]|uniref:Uncharacterized protein n=2 Tax=Dyella flagellata TaxID=1867833 RepID=A0ABQ5X8U5_9GAMM|nr:hypothetical protein GCM10007898_08980 [Dyella flagellata]
MGHIDQALWSRLENELPKADRATRQAKYIQLRAEMLENIHLRAEHLRGTQTAPRQTAFVQTPDNATRTPWPMGKWLLGLLAVLIFFAMGFLVHHVRHLPDSAPMAVYALPTLGFIVLGGIFLYLCRLLGWLGSDRWSWLYDTDSNNDDGF